MGCPGETERPPLDASVLAALAALGGEDEPTFVSDLFDTLLATAELGLAAVNAAIQVEDAAAMKAEAHRIKGAAANVGALPLLDACRRMEEAAANGQFTAARAEVENVSREIARIREATQAMRAAAKSGATSR